MQLIDRWIFDIFQSNLGREWNRGGTNCRLAWNMEAVEKLLQCPEALRYFQHVMSAVTDVADDELLDIGYSAEGLRLWFAFAKRIKDQY